MTDRRRHHIWWSISSFQSRPVHLSPKSFDLESSCKITLDAWTNIPPAALRDFGLTNLAVGLPAESAAAMILAAYCSNTKPRED